MGEYFEEGSEVDEGSLNYSEGVRIYRCGACKRIRRDADFSAGLRCPSAWGQVNCTARICNECVSAMCGLCGHAITIEDNECVCEPCPDGSGCSCRSMTYCRECELHIQYADIVQRLRKRIDDAEAALRKHIRDTEDEDPARKRVRREDTKPKFVAVDSDEDDEDE